MSKGTLEWRKNVSWWEARVGGDARMVISVENDVEGEQWSLSAEICESFGSREEAEGMAEDIAHALRECFEEMI